MESKTSLLLIPEAKTQKFPQVIDLVLEIADLYVQLLDSEDPGTVLEIETKLGYKATNPKALSNKGFDVLNCKTPYKDHIELSKWKLHKRNNKLAKDNIDKKEFDTIENYFKYKVKQDSQNFKEAPGEFSVDFQILGEKKGNNERDLNSRASYFPKDDHWVSIEKRDKTTLDILDESLGYRIAFAYEKPKDFEISGLDFNRVDCIRIKNRRYYTFGDLEYCFTTIVEMTQALKIENEQIGLVYDKFIDNFKINEKKGELMLEIFIEMGMMGFHQYEIEVEYKNYEPLIKNRKKKEVFNFLFQQFLTNTKLLTQISSEYLKVMTSKYGVDFEKIRAGGFSFEELLEN